MPSKVLAFFLLTFVLLLTSLFSSFFAGSLSIGVGKEQFSVIDRGSSEKMQLLESKLRKTLPRGEGVNLEGEDLHETMLAGKRLKKAKLKGANLNTAMLAGADLRQADLEHADLQHAMLLGANLTGANLMNANLEGANLMGAQLEGAQIDGANFKNTFLDQDQIDEACGKPKVLPEGLKVSKRC